MPAKIDIIGKNFGELIVVKEISRHPTRPVRRYLCQCSCGKTTKVCQSDLTSGDTKSCGHIQKEMYRLGTGHFKHGQARVKKHSKAYRVWTGMIARTENPKNPSFKNYGGRNIFVCRRWRESFGRFYSDMGDPPCGLSIERVDNNKGYSKKNCIWADRKTQNNNQRTNRKHKYQGQLLGITEISRRVGINHRSLTWRMDEQGLTFKQAISKG